MDSTTRSPIFTGGGVTFAVSTSFDVKVNRKARRSALRGALSTHASAGTLGVLSGAAFDEPSTKAAKALVADWAQEPPLLVVPFEFDEWARAAAILAIRSALV